jgi:hypothetical protein
LVPFPHHGILTLIPLNRFSLNNAVTLKQNKHFINGYTRDFWFAPSRVLKYKVSDALSALLEEKAQIGMPMPGKVLYWQVCDLGKTSASTHSWSLWHMS